MNFAEINPAEMNPTQMYNGATHRRIDIEHINSLVKSDYTALVAEAEEHYSAQLEEAARVVLQNRHASILLASGPSASTKTTTSNKLAARLGKDGIHCVVISLDDFFVDRAALPLLPNGEVDFESVNTLDMETLHRCFKELIQDRVSDLPMFDFKTGKRALESRRIVMNENTLAIIEGIHALNPILTEGREKGSYLKLYVSPHSDYYIGDEMVLSSRNTRFVRRVVRDFFHRGNTVEGTIRMWPNVVKSEVENIIPFRPEADIKVDSTIIYEPCIYVHYLSEFMKNETLAPRDAQRMEDMMAALSRFETLPISAVPSDTVLREFLG